ncbi:OsmC family protein [Mangrovicoccus sp. HB161399]|uniref:OsmC family protein n=1 Tax=Mangrovicoccus sp. HB161399 TaxID=2720392 RepID=UPI0015566AF6|nr:OsmC family protein [Mangrovicoccus sp. HB161399]
MKDIPARTAQQEADARIREAQSRVIARMEADLSAARSTIVTTGEIGEGLACQVQQGRFSAVLDLGPGMGGTAAGPSPGFHARAAICGCVAIQVKMLAAREGLAFDRVLVTVETDFDDAALFGLGDGPAAPLETRVAIAIDSAEDSDRIEALVDRALEMDPWYMALRDRQRVRSTLSVRPAAG